VTTTGSLRARQLSVEDPARSVDERRDLLGGAKVLEELVLLAIRACVEPDIDELRERGELERRGPNGLGLVPSDDHPGVHTLQPPGPRRDVDQQPPLDECEVLDLVHEHPVVREHTGIELEPALDERRRPLERGDRSREDLRDGLRVDLVERHHRSVDRAVTDGATHRSVRLRCEAWLRAGRPPAEGDRKRRADAVGVELREELFASHGAILSPGPELSAVRLEGRAQSFDCIG
jgi:hypothetical protein